MALGSKNVVEQVLRSTYEDGLTKELRNSLKKAEEPLKNLEKSFKILGTFVAFREVSRAFQEVAQYAREHNTQSTEIAKTLDLTQTRTLAIASNSEVFKFAMGGAIKFIEEINGLLGDVTEKMIKEKELGVEIGDAYQKSVEAEIKSGKIKGEQLDDLFMISNQVKVGLDFAKEDLRIAKEKKKELDDASVDLEKERKIREEIEKKRLAAAQAIVDANASAKKEEEDMFVLIKKRLAYETNVTEDSIAEERGASDIKNQIIGDDYEKYLKTLETKGDEEEVYAQQRIDREQRLSDTLTFISTLAQSKNKALQAVGKAAAITQATIDTYAAANVALKAAPPPFNFVLMAAVIAAGLANVAKISGVGGSGGGSRGGSVPSNSGGRDFGGGRGNQGGSIFNLTLHLEGETSDSRAREIGRIAYDEFRQLNKLDGLAF